MLRLKAEYGGTIPRDKVRAAFSLAHVLYALLLFDIHGKLGRLRLGRMLDLGMGSLQTFMRRLKDELGYIAAMPRKAHHLTDKGSRLVNDIKQEFTLISHLPVFDNFMIGEKFNAIGCVSLPPDSCQVTLELDPLELRTVALENGGTGLISIVATAQNSLKFLSAENLDLQKLFKKEWVRLHEIFQYTQGDLILIAMAPTQLDARLALISSAITAREMIVKE